MLLKISHTTTYGYDASVSYGLQQLRLRPQTMSCQKVLGWDMTIEGATLQVEYVDEHRNIVELIAVDPGTKQIAVRVSGEVETTDTAGVIEHLGDAPLWLYKRSTALTEAGSGVQALVAGVTGDEPPTLDDLHILAAEVASRIRYELGPTAVDSTAEAVIAGGAGVCQDHAHVFISCARHLGFPARYVSGYLMMDDRIDQTASHAWAEVWIDDLGWVGFDVSNGISPDERYVRVSAGSDYAGAAPTAGLWVGGGSEDIHVQVQVQQ